MDRIKAVTFDIWETLILERDGNNRKRMLDRSRKLSEILSKFGIKTSTKTILASINEMSLWLKGIFVQNKDVTHKDQIRFIIEKATNGTIVVREEWMNELSEAYASSLFDVPPYLNPDAPEVFKWLKDRGKKIVLICNTGRTPGFALKRFLEKNDVASYFDVMLFSDEIGIRKPDVKIFHLAAERLNVKPHEIIHVGDNLVSDVWGAKNAGFKAIHFSTDFGRDRTAESNPDSLVTFSRKLGDLKEEEIQADNTVNSLKEITNTIIDFED